VNRSDALDLLTGLLHRIAPEVDLTSVARDAPLQEQIDLDSMDFLNLVTALHAQTGIDVPERDYPALASVNGFLDYIVNHSTRAIGDG
jgi:acyl carrier protein